jgi:DNA helicase-4
MVVKLDSLEIHSKSEVRKIPHHDLISFCTMSRKLWGHSVIIQTKTGQLVVSGLSHFSAKSQFDELNNRIVNVIEKRIDNITTTFLNEVTDSYLRESNIEKSEDIIREIVSDFKPHQALWKQHISPSHAKRIERLARWYPVSASKRIFRKSHERKTLADRKVFYDSVESNPLTDEQRLAVIRNNDFNMVLAAAGTGKTSVIVAKAADLIERKLALQSNDVMVLAYGKKAAKELRGRAKASLKRAGLNYNLDKQISTFHSRGYQIAASVEKMSVEDFESLRMSPLTDKGVRKEFINNWLVRFIEKNEVNRRAFILSLYYAFDPFSVSSEEEYQKTLKDNKYRTLNSVKVKGYQEVLIGNWLFMNGIEYEYEPNYGSKIDKNIGFAYHPDFYLKEPDIYLEHFGLDKDGKTRADIDAEKYKRQRQSKIDLHERYGTTLKETFHYEWVDGELEKKLAKILKDAKVTLKPISPEQLVEALKNDKIINQSVKRLDNALTAVRSESIEGNKILEYLNKAKIRNADSHAFIIENLRRDYVEELRTSKKIDFDDMILRATKYLREGKFKPHWTYILVDEFQDISTSRWLFLKELYKPDDCSLTVVGDDWQSIYAFSGGKLKYTTNFKEHIKEHVKDHAITRLQTTFRYNKGIANVAGPFVMENEEQYKKYIDTKDKTALSVFIMDNQLDGKTNQIKAIEPHIKNIIGHKPSASIAILCRYNDTEKSARAYYEGQLKLQNMYFWTLHGSKGLEADYCFILDLNSGYWGFPTERKDDEVVKGLMPTNEIYPHAEERRLFYVAITRAKHASVMVADPNEPSEFVMELIQGDYKIKVLTESFSKQALAQRQCPKCKIGFFKLKDKWKKIYQCTTGLGCKTEAVQCLACGGLAAKYKGVGKCLTCKTTFQLCPRCQSPKVVRQNKKQALFIGCDSLPDEQKNYCKYAESLSARQLKTLKKDERVPIGSFVY